MSNTNIERVEFKLRQIITCKVETPSREQKYIDNTVVDLNEVGLGAHGEHTYTFPVALPTNVPVPNFSLCKLFSVEYKSQVIAKLPGVHSDLSVDMFPVIGHVPLGQSSGGFQPPPSGPTPPQEGYQYPPGGNGYQPVSQPSFVPGQYPPGYPPTSGQYSQGGQYPPSVGQYPPAGGQYPPTGGHYPSLAGSSHPPVGGVSVYPPSAPGGPIPGFNAGFNSKAEEANTPSAPGNPANQGPAPPTYTSLYTEK